MIAHINLSSDWPLILSLRIKKRTYREYTGKSSPHYAVARCVYTCFVQLWSITPRKFTEIKTRFARGMSQNNDQTRYSRLLFRSVSNVIKVV